MDTEKEQVPLIVQQLEAADALHLSRQIEALQVLEPTAGHKVTKVGGGFVLTSSTELTHKLNRASGLNIIEPLTSTTIDEVERLFARTRLPPQLDVYSHPGSEAETLLLQRGYVRTGAITIFALDLTAPPSPHTPAADPNTIIIHPLSDPSPDQHSLFLTTSVSGFLTNGRPPALLDTLARLALTRADTTTYVAFAPSHAPSEPSTNTSARSPAPAGAAALSLLPLPLPLPLPTHIPPPHSTPTTIAQLYSDSTLPAYRGRGVHRALIRHRIAEARQRGCAMAMLAARDGSGSARNAEREGLRRVYEKGLWVKEGEGEGER